MSLLSLLVKWYRVSVSPGFSPPEPHLFPSLPLPKVRRALESQEPHLASYLLSNILYYDGQHSLSIKEMIFINHQVWITVPWTISRDRLTIYD